MLTAEFVQKQWEKDSQIDKTDAGVESLRIPNLHGKYYGFLMDAKKQHREASILFKKMMLKKHEYYLGTLPKEDLDKFGWKPFQLRILRNDLQLYIEADADLNKLSLELEKHKLLVDFLEEIVKNLNNRQWQIRNYVEFQKFISGIS